MRKRHIALNVILTSFFNKIKKFGMVFLINGMKIWNERRNKWSGKMRGGLGRNERKMRKEKFVGFIPHEQLSSPFQYFFSSSLLSPSLFLSLSHHFYPRNFLWKIIISSSSLILNLTFFSSQPFRMFTQCLSREDAMQTFPPHSISDTRHSYSFFHVHFHSFSSQLLLHNLSGNQKQIMTHSYNSIAKKLNLSILI